MDKPSTSSHLSISNKINPDDLLENLQQLIDIQRSNVKETHTDTTNNEQNEDDAGTASSEIPLMLESDSKCSNVRLTSVDGKLISCFVIGGECRLCYQQFTALCLPDTSMREIDEHLNQLCIINMLANDQQLKALKMNEVVPATLPRCELITKTNAERLISKLKCSGLSPSSRFQHSKHIKVAHYCFGGCSGRLYYTHLLEPCFECSECLCRFFPQDFCRHSHTPTHTNTCYWGFDTANWPFYIHVDDSVVPNSFGQESLTESQRILIKFIDDYVTLSRSNTS